MVKKEHLSKINLPCSFSVCRTAMPADIVFLVDDSWSVGPTSFQQIKEFIADIIRAFQGSVVGQEGVRFGVTVYSDLPRSVCILYAACVNTICSTLHLCKHE